MAAPAEVIEKINTLNPSDLVLVTNLVNHLSKSEKAEKSGENVFRKARNACQERMTEDEIEEEIEAYRAEKNAASN